MGMFLDFNLGIDRLTTNDSGRGMDLGALNNHFILLVLVVEQTSVTVLTSMLRHSYTTVRKLNKHSSSKHYVLSVCVWVCVCVCVSLQREELFEDLMGKRGCGGAASFHTRFCAVLRSITRPLHVFGYLTRRPIHG
eukprot:c3067_g1_i1 orf=11-418(-)